MITTAWQLGGGQHFPGRTRLCKWAHMLGYGGHFLTKSRRDSVTFGQLRRARLEHRKRQRHPGGERDPRGRPLDETVVLVLRTWTYDGTGHTLASGPDLALTSAARARDLRPADAESCGVVGEHAQFRVQFLPLESCPADPLQYVGWGSRAILSAGLGGVEALTR
jgi:hypothetical protein